MKRLVRTLFLAGVLMAALCATAWAADATVAGIYNVTPSNSNVTIAPNGTNTADVTVDGKTVTNFYAGADQMTVTVPANSGTQYLVLALNDESPVPVENNIVYINQDGATDNSVSFKVYPSQLVSGTKYHIYVSSTDAPLTEVGTFEYYAPYILGDVNGDHVIDTTDATLAIFHVVELQVLNGNQFLAADVDKNHLVDVIDATQMIRYFLQQIDSF